jgi:O-antigen ligase/polysaccharide polymerase Wzy-like membrane protein
VTHARATLPGPFEADRAGRLARSRPRHFPSRTGPSWRGAAAAALAALAVLPLGLADGGYFGRSFTTLTVALAAAGALALLRLDIRLPSLAFAVTGGALVLLTGWVALSWLWAAPGAGVELEVRRCVLYVTALAAVGALVDRCSRSVLLLSLVAAISCLAVVGLGMRALSGVPVDPYYGSLLAEPVGYPNAMGVLTAMGAVVAIGLAAVLGRWARALQAVSSLLVLALGLSGSRGGALALAVGLGALVALSPRAQRWTCVGRTASALAVGGGAWAITMAAGGAGMPLAIAAAGAAAIGAALPTPGRRGALALISCIALAAFAVAVQHPPSTTSSYRSAYWRAALDEVGERPLLGSGAGSFFLTWREHRTVAVDVRDAHSLYLETLSELGPLGLALVLGVVAAPLATAVRGRGDPTVAAGGAAFVVFAAHAGLDWDWEMPVVTLVALACAGVVLADRTGIGAVEP